MDGRFRMECKSLLRTDGDRRSHRSVLWNEVLATLVCAALFAASVAEAKTPRWIKRTGTVLTTPVKVTVAVAKGESVSDELDKGAKAAVGLTGDALKGVRTVISADGSKTGSQKMPVPQPGPTVPSGPGNQAMIPAGVGGPTSYYAAIALVVWAMTDPDGFCEFFTGGRSKSGQAGCSIDAGISVNDQGQVSTPGSEGYHEASEEETKAAINNDFLGYMRKQFASDWEREMWEVRYIASDSLFAIFRTSAAFQGLTWLPESPGKVTDSGKLREDKDGNPRFGARRNRDKDNYGLHFGTDYAANPGDSVHAAFDGTVTYHQNAHKKFGMVIVTSASGHSQQTLYTEKIAGKDYNGRWQVRGGESVAIAANLHTGNKDGYPDSVPNHVHNAFLSPEGIYIGPSNNFAITKGTKEIANSCGTSPCISFHNDDKPKITAPRKSRP